MDLTSTNAFQNASPFGHGFNSGDNGLSAVLLAAILGRKDHDCHRGHDNCAEKIAQIIADNVGDIREQIPEVKADVAKAIQMAMLQENNNSRNTDQLIFGTDKAMLQGFERLIKEVVENRFRTKEVESNLRQALDCETDHIKEKMSNFERSVDHQFCDVKESIKDSERRVLNRLSADKLDEKNDEIARLRARCDRNESDLFIGNRMAELTAMVNSIQQDQKFISKTVQFGTGNLAGTAQTANQG